MADRSTRRAIEVLVESLQACLLCVTNQPTRIVPSLPEKNVFRLEFLPPGRAASLTITKVDSRVALRVICDVSTGSVERKTPWSKASIVAYRIDIGANMISYHWHPSGTSHVTAPHVHVASNLAPSHGAKPLDKLHLPTGFVSLAAIVRFLIEDVGVEPNRPDWDRVLTQVDAAP